MASETRWLSKEECDPIGDHATGARLGFGGKFADKAEIDCLRNIERENASALSLAKTPERKRLCDAALKKVREKLRLAILRSAAKNAEGATTPQTILIPRQNKPLQSQL